MKRQNRISQLTLELYSRGLATRKERKQVEKALETDNEVQNRYKAIQESEQETRRLYLEELRHLNIHLTPHIPPVRRRKAVVRIIAIAAIILCAFIPTFLFIKGKISNKENVIAEGSTEGSAEVTVVETTEDFFENEKEVEVSVQAATPKNKNKTETKQTGNTQNNTNPEIPSGGVSVAAVPNDDSEVRLRGSPPEQQPEPSEQESNITIPPGFTFIFENMFANRQLTSVIIPDRITSIGKNAFAGNPLVSVTVGANINMENNAFPGNFAQKYNSYGKEAGTYIRPNTDSEEWVKK